MSVRRKFTRVTSPANKRLCADRKPRGRNANHRLGADFFSLLTERRRRQQLMRSAADRAGSSGERAQPIGPIGCCARLVAPALGGFVPFGRRLCTDNNGRSRNSAMPLRCGAIASERVAAWRGAARLGADSVIGSRRAQSQSQRIAVASCNMKRRGLEPSVAARSDELRHCGALDRLVSARTSRHKAGARECDAMQSDRCGGSHHNTSHAR